MSKLRRRSFVRRVGLGLLGFIPTARTLAQSPSSLPHRPFKPLLSETLAGLALGDAVTTVVKKLGQPHLQAIAHAYGAPEWHFSGAIIVFDCLNCADMRVRQIILTAESANGTSRGIRVGSHLADLQRVYQLDSHLSGTDSIVLPLDPGRSVTFIFSNGTVSLISMQQDACATCTVEEPEWKLEPELVGAAAAAQEGN